MSEKGPKVLSDNKFNIIKQWEIATKKVTAILSYINKNTGSTSYTTVLNVASHQSILLSAPSSIL